MTIGEQVVEYLREELLRGRWSGELPGSRQISREMDTGGEDPA